LEVAEKVPDYHNTNVFWNLSLSKKGDTEGFLSGKQPLSAVWFGGIFK
jgi:hypothetical protein